jgi:hypothetical protein
MDETLLEKLSLKYGFSPSDLNMLRNTLPLKEENTHHTIFLHELQVEKERRERDRVAEEKREREEKERREREEKEQRERMIREEREKILREQFVSQKQTEMKRSWRIR